MLQGGYVEVWCLDKMQHSITNTLTVYRHWYGVRVRAVGIGSISFNLFHADWPFWWRPRSMFRSDRLIMALALFRLHAFGFCGSFPILQFPYEFPKGPQQWRSSGQMSVGFHSGSIQRGLPDFRSKLDGWKQTLGVLTLRIYRSSNRCRLAVGLTLDYTRYMSHSPTPTIRRVHQDIPRCTQSKAHSRSVYSSNSSNELPDVHTTLVFTCFSGPWVATRKWGARFTGHWVNTRMFA